MYLIFYSFVIGHLSKINFRIQPILNRYSL